jgi:hypothetical protein
LKSWIYSNEKVTFIHVSAMVSMHKSIWSVRDWTVFVFWNLTSWRIGHCSCLVLDLSPNLEPAVLRSLYGFHQSLQVDVRMTFLCSQWWLTERTLSTHCANHLSFSIIFAINLLFFYNQKWQPIFLSRNTNQFMYDLTELYWVYRSNLTQWKSLNIIN